MDKLHAFINQANRIFDSVLVLGVKRKKRLYHVICSLACLLVVAA